MNENTNQIFSLNSDWIFSDNKRFDARYYSEDVTLTKALIDKLKKNNIEIKTIEDLSQKIFWPARFKRKYVDKKNGMPFLMPSEITKFIPEPQKYISNYPGNLKVKKNSILITRSGAIGRCVISSKLLEKFVISDDLIRLIPKDDNLAYLYTYLTSKYGKSLLTKDRYGSTVKHIEAEHVSSINIPYIRELKKIVTELIMKSHVLLQQSQELIFQSQRVLHSKLNLEEINEENVGLLFEENYGIKVFQVDKNSTNLRFDAPFNEPVIKLIENNLKKSKYEIAKLSDFIEEVFIPPRFKRIYVSDKKQGIPFLSGSHLIEFTLFGLKYLWKNYENIDLYKIRKDWILISARGTVGRPYLVTNELDGYTASDNIIRCITNKKLLLPEYLTAFLYSPYAIYQIHAQKAGSVQDLLQPTHLENLLIIKPPPLIQKSIGDLIINAYEKRYKAIKLREQAIETFEKYLIKKASN